MKLFIFGPLRQLNRDLNILFWSTLIWTFGLGVYNYVWPIFLEGLNADPSQVGLVYSIGYIAIAASMIPGGLLASKYDLKPLIVLGWAVSIPVPLIYYFAHTWTDTIPGFVLLEASGFNLPAFNAYIASVGQQRTAASNFGIVFASAPLGIALGPLLGAWLLTFTSIRQTFLVSLALFTASSILIFFIKSHPTPRLAKNPTRRKLGFPTTKIGIILLLFLCISGIAYSTSSFFFPLYFKNILKQSNVLIQVLGSAQQFGAAVFAILLGRRADNHNRGATMALGLLLAATGILGILVFRTFLFAVPMIFLFGAARGPSIVGYSILSRLENEKASKAGQYGTYLTLESTGLVIGSYLGGFLFTVNSSYGFLFSVILFIVLAVVVALTGFGEKIPLKIAEPQVVVSPKA